MSDTTQRPPKEHKRGQFCRYLCSSESARDDAQAKGVMIPADAMQTVTCPPGGIFRAYSDLLSHVLVFQRGLFHLKELDVDEAHDLADAMHNIGDLLVDYGVRLDDEKYRELYLRPFDRRWAHDGFGLEQFLESRLKRYNRTA